jgi:hypothetical protein
MQFSHVRFDMRFDAHLGVDADEAQNRLEEIVDCRCETCLAE